MHSKFLLLFSAVIGTFIQLISFISDDQTLQIYYVNEKTLLKKVDLKENIVYLKWITSTMLCIVTKATVLHWNMESDSLPYQVFARKQSLKNHTIVDYMIDAQQKWFLLACHLKVNDQVAGVLHLYSVESQCSHTLTGYVACFETMRVKNVAEPCTMLCYASQPDLSRNICQINIILPGISTKDSKECSKQTTIQFSADAPSDYPISVHMSKNDIVFLFTHYGYFYVNDIQADVNILVTRVSTYNLIGTVNNKRDEIVAVNYKSEVCLITFNMDKLEQYVTNKFDYFIRKADFSRAAKIATIISNGIFHDKVIEKLRTVQTESNSVHPLLMYFDLRFKKNVRYKANKMESVEIAWLTQGSTIAMNMLKRWFEEGRLESSQQLGDVIRPNNLKLASMAYRHANLPIKLIECYIEMDLFESIIYKPEYNSIHSKIIELVCQLGHFDKAERLCQTSHSYDPEHIKKYLMSANFIDHMPLIAVCERFNYVEDLIVFFYKQK